MELSKSSITHISPARRQQHSNQSERKTDTDWDASHSSTRSRTITSCLAHILLSCPALCCCVRLLTWLYQINCLQWDWHRWYMTKSLFSPCDSDRYVLWIPKQSIACNLIFSGLFSFLIWTQKQKQNPDRWGNIHLNAPIHIFRPVQFIWSTCNFSLQWYQYYLTLPIKI